MFPLALTFARLQHLENFFVAAVCCCFCAVFGSVNAARAPGDVNEPDEVLVASSPAVARILKWRQHCMPCLFETADE